MARCSMLLICLVDLLDIHQQGASDANELDFPVKPGAEMPPIPGCQKQDYAVLFVLAVDRDSTW